MLVSPAIFGIKILPLMWKFRRTASVRPKIREAIPYDGIVWCPNVENGTAIFRNIDGGVFISGNCQSPFSNVTLDWVCPPDMRDTPAIVGGKEMDFTYGDCKKEMDMVNKAFIEIMIEGDANGRGFQYPIPTTALPRTLIGPTLKTIVCSSR